MGPGGVEGGVPFGADWGRGVGRIVHMQGKGKGYRGLGARAGGEEAQISVGVTRRWVGGIQPCQMLLSMSLMWRKETTTSNRKTHNLHGKPHVDRFLRVARLQNEIAPEKT